LTIRLAALAMLFGLMVAVTCAYLRTSGPQPVRAVVAVYVEGIRNTPFLVQLYIIFFSLPAIGIRLEANQAALAAMIINLGAYATEIVRAGVQSVPPGQIEVGLALGLKRLQIYRLIVLFPRSRRSFRRSRASSSCCCLVLRWCRRYPPMSSPPSPIRCNRPRSALSRSTSW
jgi:polar amino acid transport system permease protein